MIDTTFRPKKSLGQNFLVDENIARKIIRQLAPTPQDVVVEIGAGFGVLTKYLLPAAKKVIAVEIDGRLAQTLRGKFGRQEKFNLIEGDFLKIDLAEIYTGSEGLRIVGNIPYHITSPVIFKIFDVCRLVADMTLMIQQEVAQRIVAAPGSKDYGILSVFSQLYSEPKILFQVSKNVFRPRPEVDSSVVRWDFSRPLQVEISDHEILDRVIHATFQQRRKMLRKSLQQIAEIADNIRKLNFNLEKRPEELTPEEFVQLANEICRIWKRPT
jgi:16S rRNA (adenine1518-N6/adenine1519-N6)-dimethyltransferase